MFNAEFIVPLLLLSIPIFAIIGGIVAGIVRSAGQQRMLELAQRERIAAIERGIDPAKLPTLPMLGHEMGLVGFSPYESAKRRAQNLVIGGLVTSFGGAGLLVFLNMMEENDRVWAAALIPILVGVALLLSAWLVWPRNGAKGGHAGPGASA
jgi:hypothetical protein